MYSDISSLTLKEGVLLSILPTYLVPRKQEHILWCNLKGWKVLTITAGSTCGLTFGFLIALYTIKILTYIQLEEEIKESNLIKDTGKECSKIEKEWVAQSQEVQWLGLERWPRNTNVKLVVVLHMPVTRHWVCLCDCGMCSYQLSSLLLNNSYASP